MENPTFLYAHDESFEMYYWPGTKKWPFFEGIYIRNGENRYWYRMDLRHGQLIRIRGKARKFLEEHREF